MPKLIHFFLLFFISVSTAISLSANDIGCDLSILEITPTCSDNGTPSDPSDDFYVVFVNASVISGGASGTFEILVAGSSIGTFNYDVGGNITLPADGTVVTLVFADSDDLNCSQVDVVGPLTTCSSECALTITQANPSCNDNGTPSDPVDDFYTIFVNASVLNGGSQFNVFDGTNTNTFSYGVGGNITVPATGTMLNLVFSDVGNPNCTASQMLGPLTTCSDDCPSILQITSNPISGVYEASMTVITVGPVVVQNGENVTFKGGQTVEMEIGFEVETNAIFEAKNESCTGQ